MKQVPFLVFAGLLAAGPLPAREDEAPPAKKVYTVTVILRRSGENIPDKFTSYLHGLGSQVTMPLFTEDPTTWVARIETEAGSDHKPPRFDLRIADSSLLEPQSSRAAPFTSRPVEVLRVTLPLALGEELVVFKSKSFSLSVLFEP